MQLTPRIMQLSLRWSASARSSTPSTRRLRPCARCTHAPVACSPACAGNSRLSRASAQAGQNTSELQERSKALKKGIVAAEESAKEMADARDKAIMPIGNLVPDSVPISNDEVGWARLQCWLLLAQHALASCCLAAGS